MTMPRLASILPFVASLALAGCIVDSTATTDTTQGTKKNAAPIIDGVASPASDNAAVWVGILSDEGYPMGSCSGVLIADNILLTARHCVARTTDGGIGCKKDGTPVSGSGGAVRSDYDAASLAIVIGPTLGRGAKAAARGKKIVHSGAKHLCNNDIAVVILDRKVVDAPIAQIRLDGPPKKGEKITAIGFGVSNTSGRGRKRRADIPITLVGPISTSGEVLGPNEFAIGEGICSGDSGGPAMSGETGAVLGVVSRGGNGAPYDPETDPPYTNCVDSDEYKTHNIYTRVDTFKDMIMSAFEEAGSEPWIEGGPDPRKAKLGEGCEGPDSCRSGLCIDVGGKKICSETCTEAACPAGYTCTPVGDTKVCAPAAPVTENPGTTTNAADVGATGGKGGCSVSPGSSAGATGTLAILGISLLALRRRKNGV